MSTRLTRRGTTGMHSGRAEGPRSRGNRAPGRTGICRWLAAISTGLMLAGCSLPPSRDALSGEPAPRAEPQAVTVFFATDRAAGLPGDPAQAFTAERGATAYGTARMVLDQPPPANRGEKDPSAPARSSVRAVRDVLTGVQRNGATGWLDTLASAARATPDRAVLVYIHGFDTAFEEAVQDAARLKAGLGFDGPVVAFSWPSRASVSAYIADETSARWAIPHLEAVLRELVALRGLGSVHLLAHSMGARVLLPVVSRLHQSEKRRRWPFGEVILLAPDLDREIFLRDTLPEMSGLRSRISLYISGQDPAMVASEAVNIYPRLGDARRGPAIAPGVETIDITPVATLSSAHAYFREHPAVLSDLAELVIGRKGADQRSALVPTRGDGGTFWQLVPVTGGDRAQSGMQ